MTLEQLVVLAQGYGVNLSVDDVSQLVRDVDSTGHTPSTEQ